ncbi:unnamed protein product [Polarella glacialis]|uniref:Uncharacterized protein n=1 Tax=Polarella glacialis TaxID=89957 RepID=A0A813I837_POLGL|nr:unnamed protein product [Polarella glacialis]
MELQRRGCTGRGYVASCTADLAPSTKSRDLVASSSGGDSERRVATTAPVVASVVGTSRSCLRAAQCRGHRSIALSGRLAWIQCTDHENVVVVVAGVVVVF